MTTASSLNDVDRQTLGSIALVLNTGGQQADGSWALIP